MDHRVAMHEVVIDERDGYPVRYWWKCSCGDEGGPYGFKWEVWEATLEHDK